MKGRTIPFLIALVLLLSGCTSNVGRQAIHDAVAESEEVCASIVDIVNWQLEGTEEFRKQREVYKKSGDERDLPEDDIAQVEAKYDELTQYRATLGELRARVDAIKDEKDAVTLEAAKDYFTMLDSAVGDLATIFEYFFAVREAVKPMAEFEAPESTTVYVDYSLFAGQLSQVVGVTQRNISALKCPSYMQDSHKAFAARIDEYQSFCQDFSIAVQLSDPLRIASCNYRLSRLDVMIEKCDDALTDDFNLQFERVLQRMDGAIAQLRGELLANTAQK